MTTTHHPVGSEVQDLGAGEGAPAVIIFMLLAAALLVVLIGMVWRIGAKRGLHAPRGRTKRPRRPEHPAHTEARPEPDALPGAGDRR